MTIEEAFCKVKDNPKECHRIKELFFGKNVVIPSFSYLLEALILTGGLTSDNLRVLILVVFQAGMEYGAAQQLELQKRAEELSKEVQEDLKNNTAPY